MFRSPLLSANLPACTRPVNALPARYDTPRTINYLHQGISKVDFLASLSAGSAVYEPVLLPGKESFLAKLFYSIEDQLFIL